MTVFLKKTQSVLSKKFFQLTFALALPVFLVLHQSETAKASHALDHVAHMIHHIGDHFMSPKNNHVSGNGNESDNTEKACCKTYTRSVQFVRRVEIFKTKKGLDSVASMVIHERASFQQIVSEVYTHPVVK